MPLTSVDTNETSSQVYTESCSTSSEINVDDMFTHARSGARVLMLNEAMQSSLTCYQQTNSGTSTSDVNLLRAPQNEHKTHAQGYIPETLDAMPHKTKNDIMESSMILVNNTAQNTDRINISMSPEGEIVFNQSKENDVLAREHSVAEIRSELSPGRKIIFQTKDVNFVDTQNIIERLNHKSHETNPTNVQSKHSDVGNDEQTISTNKIYVQHPNMYTGISQQTIRGKPNSITHEPNTVVVHSEDIDDTNYLLPDTLSTKSIEKNAFCSQSEGNCYADEKNTVSETTRTISREARMFFSRPKNTDYVVPQLSMQEIFQTEAHYTDQQIPMPVDMIGESYEENTGLIQSQGIENNYIQKPTPVNLIGESYEEIAVFMQSEGIENNDNTQNMHETFSSNSIYRNTTCHEIDGEGIYLQPSIPKTSNVASYTDNPMFTRSKDPNDTYLQQATKDRIKEKKIIDPKDTDEQLLQEIIQETCKEDSYDIIQSCVQSKDNDNSIQQQQEQGIWVTPDVKLHEKCELFTHSSENTDICSEQITTNSCYLDTTSLNTKSNDATSKTFSLSKTYNIEEEPLFKLNLDYVNQNSVESNCNALTVNIRQHFSRDSCSCCANNVNNVSMTDTIELLNETAINDEMCNDHDKKSSLSNVLNCGSNEKRTRMPFGESEILLDSVALDSFYKPNDIECDKYVTHNRAQFEDCFDRLAQPKSYTCNSCSADNGKDNDCVLQWQNINQRRKNTDIGKDYEIGSYCNAFDVVQVPSSAVLNDDQDNQHTTSHKMNNLEGKNDNIKQKHSNN